MVLAVEPTVTHSPAPKVIPNMVVVGPAPLAVHEIPFAEVAKLLVPAPTAIHRFDPFHAIPYAAVVTNVVERPVHAIPFVE